MSEPFKNRAILMITDNAHSAKALSSTLRRNGCQTIIASGAVNVLECIEILQPDLVLLDVQTARANGLELFRILRNQSSATTPVILLATGSEKSAVAKEIQSKSVDYITTPINESELMFRINACLELIETKRALHRKVDELKAIYSIKNKFCSMIAHDLLNPFNALINAAELLIEGNQLSETDKMELIQAVLTTSKQGYHMLKNLLDWSRFQIGNINIDRGQIDLSIIAEENIALTSIQAKVKNIKIVNRLDDVSAFADYDMIDAVLRNLLANAIKFTNSGGKIEIFSKRIDTMIQVTVADSGVGLTTEDVEKLFRSDINPKTIGCGGEKGSGIGLILCHEFIQLNHGKIWAESELGRGTRFHFLLPVTEQVINKASLTTFNNIGYDYLGKLN
jgi:signal transduction histidine kinase